ncbi:MULTISPECIES: ArsR/SmtB family transcription factor [Pontibacillus]|uniref:Metalloregulator ArsR/SmtB family transcription factor n=1 Tax=Pontibacillus chungwhensis TaxID=265426 RepID=A0ABY8V0V6_9BACI|nr:MULTISPECIES: metalloregulator ArsR/SmtB family transcription factor [Pontibacillus]MCD5324576.1 metalloregulator ArsR/SmtB family transcription factor [Pontibacillus sp. HN14]WIF99128.1 metalloregulator ArsR/SmtB family transcription factor [Pontibacillus chungwhensis]
MSQPLLSVEESSKVLKLVGDQTRLTIVGLLKDQELCVCELVEILEMSQPSVSQHLKKLRSAGIVKEKRQGHWMFYSLNEDHAAVDLISDILTHMPDQKEKIEALEQSGKRIVCE